MGRRGDPNNFQHAFEILKETARLPTTMMINDWNALNPSLKATGDYKTFRAAFKDAAIQLYNNKCCEKKLLFLLFQVV